MSGQAQQLWLRLAIGMIIAWVVGQSLGALLTIGWFVAWSDLHALRSAKAASASKGTFLAQVSHEIRTLLNGVLGMAQIMKTGELSHEQRLQRRMDRRRRGERAPEDHVLARLPSARCSADEAPGVRMNSPSFGRFAERA